MRKTNYYIKRDNTYYLAKTKEEILSTIDNYDFNTVCYYLQEMNYPFIEEEWLRMVERYNNGKVFGRYLSLMRLKGYQLFTFEDSERLNQMRKEKNLDTH